MLYSIKFLEVKMKIYLNIIIVIFIIVLSSCTANKKVTKSQKVKLPICYKTGSHISYPESKYISAYSFDNSEKKVMLLARAELSQKISSSLTAKNLILKKAYRKNSKLISSSVKFKQMVKVESSFKHNELIEIVDTYDYDGKYYAFAVINRSKYASVLESEMAILNDSFKIRYKQALEFLDKLNIKDFKKIKKDLIMDAFKYETKLANYSTVLNDQDIYKKHSLIKNITSLNTLYKRKLNQDWYIYAIYNKIDKYDFKKIIKKDPSNSPWILRDNDENRTNYVESKDLTRSIYETIRDERYKASELSQYNYSSKKMIVLNELDNIIKLLGSGKDKVVVTAVLIYKCSYDKAFYYCRTGAEVKAYNLNNKEQLFYFSVEGQTSRKTKASDLDLKEVIKKSVKKLSPILKKRLIDYMKDYKDLE